MKTAKILSAIVVVFTYAFLVFAGPLDRAESRYYAWMVVVTAIGSVAVTSYVVYCAIKEKAWAMWICIASAFYWFVALSIVVAVSRGFPPDIWTASAFAHVLACMLLARPVFRRNVHPSNQKTE